MKYIIGKVTLCSLGGTSEGYLHIKDEKEVYCPKELIGISFEKGTVIVHLDEERPDYYRQLKNTSEPGKYELVGRSLSEVQTLCMQLMFPA